MKIVVIGSTPKDFEIGCLNTLRRLTNLNHTVNFIIVRNKTRKEKEMETSDLCFRGTNIFVIKNFDYSKVTQENVNLINSIVETINPSVAFIPFIKSSDNMKKILSKSSLLACRKIQSILMYEIIKNKNFSPTVFSIINKSIKQNVTSKAKKSSKNTSRNVNVLYKMYANKMGIPQLAEVFESHRMVLLQNDIF